MENRLLDAKSEMGMEGGRKMGVDTKTYTCDKTVEQHTNTICIPCYKKNINTDEAIDKNFQ